MTSSVTCGYAAWMDGGTYNGQLLRTNLVAAMALNAPGMALRGGVFPSGGQMIVSAGSGLTVGVATGACLIPSVTGSAYGGYTFSLTSPATLTVATPDPTSPRVDLVCAFATDDGNSTSSCGVEIIAGTPTAGATLGNLNGAPSLPGTPTSALMLGYVLVTPSATSVTGNVTSNPAETVAQGGILAVTLGFQPVGYTGMIIFDKPTQRLLHNPAAGPAQVHVLPFTPQSARQTSPVSGLSTICSVTVTTDGNTDIEIVAKWPSLISTSTSAVSAFLALAIDGTQVAAIGAACSNGSPGFSGGGNITHITTSGVDRPAAGTHTVVLEIGNVELSGFSGNVSVGCSSVLPATLYVRPAPL